MRRTSRARMLWIVVCLALSACGGGGGETADAAPDMAAEDAATQTDAEPDVPPVPLDVVLGGALQKGPFVVGSSVQVSLLDWNLNPTGLVFNTQTVNDHGEFNLSFTTSGPVLIEGQGFYYDEHLGALSTAPLTLHAFYLPTTGGEQHAYVNILTQLISERLKTVVAGGARFDDAVTQAETELRQELAITCPQFAPQRHAVTTSIEGGDDDEGAFLLAVSGVFMAVAGKMADDAGGWAQYPAIFQELLNSTALDFADGWLDADLKANVTYELRYLSAEGLMDRLAERFQEIGSTATVPNVNRVLDQDRDGLCNIDDPCRFVPDTACDGDGIGCYPSSDPPCLATLDCLACGQWGYCCLAATPCQAGDTCAKPTETCMLSSYCPGGPGWCCLPTRFDYGLPCSADLTCGKGFACAERYIRQPVTSCDLGLDRCCTDAENVGGQVSGDAQPCYLDHTCNAGWACLQQPAPCWWGMCCQSLVACGAGDTCDAGYECRTPPDGTTCDGGKCCLPVGGDRQPCRGQAPACDSFLSCGAASWGSCQFGYAECCIPTWEVVPSGTVSSLYHVWGSSANDVWATGGAVQHWNGTSWSGRGAGITSFSLGAVWGAGPDDAWLAANDSAYHWNGSGWTQYSLGSASGVLAAWGSATNDVWLAANIPVNGNFLHWNGTAWAPSYTPYPYYGPYGSLWGSGSEVWAAGDGLTVLRWQGAAWAPAPYPPARVESLGGSSTNDVWAVGANGVIIRWDGTQWTTYTSNTTENLHAVWASSTTNAWAVGDIGTIMHWDGTSWSQVPSGTVANLQSVWGASAGEVWAVGLGGTILRYRL